MKVFILHATKLSARKPHVDKLVATLSDDTHILSGAWSSDLWPVAAPEKDECFDRYRTTLTPANLDNLAKHASAIQQISLLPVGSVALVLEDDVIYDEEHFRGHLDRVTEHMSDRGLIFLGLPLPSNDDVVTNVTLEYPVLPACDSYLMSQSFAARFIDVFKPFRYSANVNFSYALKQLGHPTWAASDHIFLDGSKYGPFLSSIENNAFLPYNNEFTSTYTKLMAGGNEDLLPVIEKLKFQNHPAVMHLRALALLRRDEHIAAHAIMRSAYDILSQNGCMVGGTNPIVKTYISTMQYSSSS